MRFHCSLPFVNGVVEKIMFTSLGRKIPRFHNTICSAGVCGNVAQLFLRWSRELFFSSLSCSNAEPPPFENILSYECKLCSLETF